MLDSKAFGQQVMFISAASLGVWLSSKQKGINAKFGNNGGFT